MCWALVQRGFTSSVHSLQVVVEYQKGNMLQCFEQGLQMFHSARKRAFVSFFFCLFYAHTCLWSHAFSTAIHPPFPSPSLGAVSSPIVSIQLAVITNSSLITEFIWLVENNGGSRLSFHSPCHQYCLPLWRELNGACL